MNITNILHMPIKGKYKKLTISSKAIESILSRKVFDDLEIIDPLPPDVKIVKMIIPPFTDFVEIFVKSDEFEEVDVPFWCLVPALKPTVRHHKTEDLG